ncbi:DUF6455 family protein [Sinimarinibacterium sp. CAU 1509]|uniref:DUF6455 family protein n=1 Tax=Sinimarinibacterium sp. CAU 1509 TaxID=2562283 RepID=UPI001B7FE8FE|nr:DUF6455 family protein [Sinimarinibacterium sp. CAU 1509]
MVIESAQQLGWVMVAAALGMAVLQWRYMRSGALYGINLVGFSERLEVSREIQRLPLGEMLRRRGVELDSYVLGLSSAELHTVARECSRCKQFDRCVSTLADEPMAVDYSFCANDASIARASVAQLS